uniref:Uncharacterized protein n=1 Tax=Strombidium inclinatum TaxID=197538 RepID=A0A7S3IHB3_9SPIT|mmetsp:Transcript_17335/g.26717  ORF Transcript_17335/g.26717 Transcript_17335/m.26717 type:complete len:348 (+) Transcript_17335:656-1699(+)
MSCNLTELALEQVQAHNGVLLSVQVEVVPELANSLVEEADSALVGTGSQRTEDQMVGSDTVGLQVESAVTDQSFTVVENLEGDGLTQRVTQRNLSGCCLSNEGLEIDGSFWLRRVSSHFHGPPHEALFTVLESDGGGVYTSKERSNSEVIGEGLAALDSELLLSDSVLEVGPNGVILSLVRVVPDLEVVVSGLSGLAVEHDVVFGEGLFANTLQLILILFLGRLILQGEQALSLAYPLRSEGQLEVLSDSLLNEHLATVEREIASLALLERGDDLPLLTGVVHNGDLLRDMAPRRHSELELSLDLLRDGRQLVLVKTDVSSIEGLQDDIASVRSRLSRVAVQLQDVH